MEGLSVVYSGLAIVAVAFIVRWYTHPLRAIPTIGGSDLPLLSYRGAFKWVNHGKDMLQEGYDKYQGGTFKIAMLDRWLVVANGPKLVEEVSERPDDELNNVDGLDAFIQTKYTLGREIHYDQCHVDVIRNQLTRGLSKVLPNVIDELAVAVPEHIPTNGDDWVGVCCTEKMLKIVARASNRVFVGLPLCCVPGYLDAAVGLTLSVNEDRGMINMFPEALKPIIGRLVSHSSTSIRQAKAYLAPMIEERRRMMVEYGEDWSEKPNDMLQWIMEAAAARDPSIEAIVKRILAINFAAIHTSSASITHAIYHLAERPELLHPLREEIETLLKEGGGWTKSALTKMWKLDSFLRESQRYNGFNLVSLMRVAQKGITLSDGTFIPKGTLVTVPSYSMHHDDATIFDAFRYSRMRERDGEAARHQFVNTSIGYVTFGHGKHACPGRFFAASELKAMLGYIVLNYDLKLPGIGRQPSNTFRSESIIAAPNAEVMFRKRKV